MSAVRYQVAPGGRAGAGEFGATASAKRGGHGDALLALLVGAVWYMHTFNVFRRKHVR